MSLQYPFRNLVFHSGGVRAFAYHGVLPVLEEYGVLPQIERVAGASAGAMTAAMVSFRLSAQETVDLFRTLDYSKISNLADASSSPSRTNAPLASSIEEGWERLVSGFNALTRIGRKYGLYDVSYPYAWMTETIASQSDGDGRATFADFQQRGFRDLFIVTTNVSTHQIAIFNADKTPDVAVIDALLMSQSIPFFFEAPRFDGKQLGVGDYYGDGGLLNGFPLELFDEPEYEVDNEWFIGGVNWETLGCHLHAPDAEPDAIRRRKINSISDYVTNVIELLVEAQSGKFKHDPVARRRTIDINHQGVSATNFGIKLTPDDPTYLRLITAGEVAARTYLATYQPPPRAL